MFEFQVPSLIWPFHLQMKSDRKGPYINNPMSLPRLGKCFFFFSFFLFALEKQFLPNVQVFYLVLSFGLSPVTLKCRIIFIQLRVNGPKLSYNSIILKGKNWKRSPWLCKALWAKKLAEKLTKKLARGKRNKRKQSAAV